MGCPRSIPLPVAYEVGAETRLRTPNAQKQGEDEQLGVHGDLKRYFRLLGAPG
jgi:hypothetical protein